MKFPRMPWLKNRRLWWTAFFLLLCTVAGQAYMTVPRTVLTHEMMAKLNDPREVRLIFVGDTGSGKAHQLSVARQMEELCQSVQPAAVVMLGDNFYQEGVQTVDDPLWQERFEQVYTGACLDQLSFYAILGNHDYRGSADAQIAYSQAGSGKWMMPARYYSLRFGEILELGAIDSNIPDQCGIASVCSIDWILQQLKKSNAAWKVLIGHHPMLSGGKYKKLKWHAQMILPNLYCRSGVSAYISGHDHGLQHLHGRVAGSNCSIEQFVSGGGGADLYPIDTLQDRTLYADAAHGVLLGRFTPHEQRYEFYKVGSQNPQYIWSKRKED